MQYEHADPLIKSDILPFNFKDFFQFSVLEIKKNENGGLQTLNDSSDLRFRNLHAARLSDSFVSGLHEKRNLSGR